MGSSSFRRASEPSEAEQARIDANRLEAKRRLELTESRRRQQLEELSTEAVELRDGRELAATTGTSGRAQRPFKMPRPCAR